MCVQGKSFEPGREFLQTRRLKFRSDGPPLGELLNLVVSHTVRERLWPQLKATEVQVMPFDEQVCGEQPMAELAVNYGLADLAALEAERSRGPGERPLLDTLARHAEARPAPAKAPPPLAMPREARKHEWVRLFFATTRRATGAREAPQAFGDARSDVVSFGTVDVSIPADHRYANLESPSVFRMEWDLDPKRHVWMAPDFRPLAMAQWQLELSRRAGAFKGGVLVFVHGYNTSFEDSVKRAAQIAYDLAFPGPTVLYSWPSDGELLAYVKDEEAARNAWRQMAQVLDHLTYLGSGVPVYLVAHSMGNRVLTQGLAELLRRRPDADLAIREVVMASPDIGEEEFRQRWVHELNSTNAPRFTLYASNHDLPIALSAWLHGEPRLGSGGPGIAVFPHVDSIDASRITREWFGLSHSYFGDNETLVSDLHLVINRGLPPEKRPRLRPMRGTRGTYWEFRP
jgi:esterase/lipase superfamily enzyme